MIKITPADRTFSQFIRLRDGGCCRCGSRVRLNEKGLPVSHTASHFYGRGKQGTRFDPLNVDTLCYPCHNLWAGHERPDYTQYKIDHIGQKEFDLMTLRAYSYHKKDYKMALIQAKLLLAEVLPVVK